MEAVMMHGSLDQSISPYDFHLKNPKLFYQNQFINSNPADVFWLSRLNSTATGLLQPPPPFLSQPFSPYPVQQSQPPLLPLPTLARGLSCPPANKKLSNPSRTLTPKKSKSPKKSKEEKNLPKRSTSGMMIGVKNGGSSLRSVVEAAKQVDMFSGSTMLAISPPPSSLPLPTFSLRPKHGCQAEPAGINSGATDDLRRLLRLR